jgi:hypothetical protein
MTALRLVVPFSNNLIYISLFVCYYTNLLNMLYFFIW